MQPVIFLGPSLSVEKAKSILPFADYRPPARKGDFQRLEKENVQFVGFADGVFLQDYPPTPIEVYNLIKKGTMLVGAASLGALRAVELEKFGMRGIGKIFELYKKGVLDSDDEVAVTFSEHDYKLQSEALIDIRYTLYHACKEGIIDRNVKKLLVKNAKNIYFPYRNYDELFARVSGVVDVEVLETLRKYLKTNRRSLKEEDTVRLIRFIKELCLGSLK
ncbi:MAG: TfuA-like protein [Nitrososphaerales archaeon]